MEPLPTNSQWERVWECMEQFKYASMTQIEAALTG